MISDRIRAMTGLHWLMLFGAILLSWSALFAMSLPADLRAANQFYGRDFIEALCAVTLDGAGFVRVFAMWGLMSLAMMAPTAFPAFATYDDLSQTAPNTNFLALVGGYLGVWLGFSVLAASVQMGLFSLDLVSSFGDSRSRVLSATLLAVAGAYQFTDIKEACLSKCRQPMTFFMQHWDEGALRNGVRLGLVCLGCCWALMTLAFVGGVMNLAFMGLATVIMVLEKLPDIGQWVTRPLGVLLLGLAGYTLIFGL